MPKAKEFGLMFESPRARETVARGRLAEELGFSSFWMFEDYVFPGAFSCTSAIAAQTKKIKIGIGVLNPFTRHPVLTAMELAALDELSDGRAALGIGASLKLWIEDQLGIPYGRPVTALREAVEIIRRLLSGEQLRYQGRIFRGENFQFLAPPIRTHVPIYLGVAGPKGPALAGELADGVVMNAPVTPAFVRFATEQIRRGAASTGRSLDNFALAQLVPISLAISGDDRVARDAVKPFLAWVLALYSSQPTRSVIFDHVGLTPEMASKFRERFAKGDVPVDLVGDTMIDALAITGSPERCREALGRLIEVGVSHPMVVLPQGMDSEDNVRHLYTRVVQHLL